MRVTDLYNFCDTRKIDLLCEDNKNQRYLHFLNFKTFCDGNGGIESLH